MQPNSLDYISLTNTITELTKLGKTELVNQLLYILSNNEFDKPDNHNRKSDINTSYFLIDLNQECIENIIDLLLDLEAGSLDEKFESTGLTNHYADLVDRWSKFVELK